MTPHITEVLPFDHEHPYPGDLRMQRPSTVERDAISIYIRWEGMTVYCIADKTTYQLQGGVANTNWVSTATSAASLDGPAINRLIGYTPYNGATNPLGFLTATPTLEQVLRAGNSADQAISTPIEYTGAIQIARAGAVNDPYGAIAITFPSNVNSYSYYSMTRAGNVAWNMGINSGNNLFFGIGGGGLDAGGNNIGSSNLMSLDRGGNGCFAGSLTAASITTAALTSTQQFTGINGTLTGTLAVNSLLPNTVSVAGYLETTRLIVDTSIMMSSTNYVFADGDSYASLGIGIGTQSGFICNIPRQQILVGAANTTPPTTGTFRGGDIYIVTDGTIYVRDTAGAWHASCNCATSSSSGGGRNSASIT